jgi:MFS family permease
MVGAPRFCVKPVRCDGFVKEPLPRTVCHVSSVALPMLVNVKRPGDYFPAPSDSLTMGQRCSTSVRPVASPEMNSVQPPIPPRPDLPPGAAPRETWHVVSPGRMGATTIVGAGMKLWSEHWVRWGLLTLLFTGIAGVVAAALDPWASTYGATWTVDRPPGVPEADPLAGVVGLIGGLFLGPWLAVILARASLEATFGEADRRSLVGRTIRGVPSVLWILILLFLCGLVLVIPLAILVATMRNAGPSPQEAAVGIFVLVFFVLLLWIAPRLLILLHVFVGEDRRGTKAIGETWKRSRGAWGAALGVLVLNLLIAIGIALIPGIVAEQAFSLPTVEDAVPRAILYALVSAIVSPIGVAIGAALYLELSARKGTLDQTSLRRNLARFDPIEGSATPP